MKPPSYPHRTIKYSLSLLGVGLLIAEAHAFTASDLIGLTIIEDFQFNDPIGTDIPSLTNNAGTGHTFDADADTSAVVTNGSGQLNASLKNNNDFGTNYIDNDTLIPSVGHIFGVFELTWNFLSALDPAENEEIRFSFMQFDPRSTFVVAEMEITRTDNDEIVILGNGVGTGSTDLGPVTLSKTQSDTFISVLDVDMDNDVYSVFYSTNGGLNFNTLGTGDLDPDRNTIDSTRLVLNNDLTNDNVLIDRMYVAKPSGSKPTRVPDPTSTALAFLIGLAPIAWLKKRARH